VKLGYIRHSPAKGVELPADQGDEVIPPTGEQVSLLLIAAREIGGVAYAIILLAVSTGMRRGEILALRYSDIDWFSSEIVIRQAIKKAKSTQCSHSLHVSKDPERFC
jgi:integrase